MVLDGTIDHHCFLRTGVKCAHFWCLSLGGTSHFSVATLALVCLFTKKIHSKVARVLVVSKVKSG